MKDLLDVRKEWEKGLTPKCVLGNHNNTIVVLFDEISKTYYANRYFTLAGEWTCSIDESGVEIDTIFEYLEYHTK